MTIGNHNNELNAHFHREAVKNTFHAFRVVGDEMKAMLDLPCWDDANEKRYDELMESRAGIINRLKLQGMFL